ncbi:MAG TPA: COX15/CtaA family protein [Gaiellaceae bacterium]|nr:COX15/CtaA family protein [Gaiellaceae bacterium]
MESAPQALPRRRALELSPEGFRRLALAATGMLVLIVATGATVRLTGSGLGCEHWPGCQPNVFFPERGYHSDVEFSNRIVASLTVAATLVLALGALRTPGLSRNVKLLAAAVFTGTLAQAPLGAITVHFHLNPYLVISHMLLSLVVLGLVVLVLLEATRLRRGSSEAVPAVARAGGVALLVSVGLLVVSGTLATAAGPHPGSSGTTSVRRIGSFDPAVALHVRAVAAFGLVFLVLAVWAWRNRERFPWLVRGCAGLLAILVVQMTIGEVQFRTNLPWWLVLVHVSVAAALFAWTVGVAARLWRPLSAGNASRFPRSDVVLRRADAG